MEKLRFIVAATGRSGTVYAARLLTSLGIPCGHESIFSEKGLSVAIDRLSNLSKYELSHCSTHDIIQNTPIPKWLDENIVAESSYLVVPFLDIPQLADIPLIHIVRHPMDVISSFVKGLNYFSNETPGDDPWQKIIYDFLPSLHHINGQIERACHFYIKWNEAIEVHSKKRPYIRLNVENIHCDEFYSFINKPKTTNVFDDKTINTLNIKEKIRLKDISQPTRQKIIEKMNEYNYKHKIFL